MKEDVCQFEVCIETSSSGLNFTVEYFEARRYAKVHKDISFLRVARRASRSAGSDWSPVAKGETHCYSYAHAPARPPPINYSAPFRGHCETREASKHSRFILNVNLVLKHANNENF
jgi:hypothetical protein